MNENILFVDDEPHILRAYQRRFRGKYHIQCAPGPQEALALLEQGAPLSLVITDFRMPGMDGAEFLEHVRRRSPNTLQIMLTGNATLGSWQEAVDELRIFRLLSKPCPAEMLAQAIEDALAQYRRNQRETPSLLDIERAAK